MAQVSPAQILVALRRFFFRILKLNPCRKFLEAIFRRLTFLWSTLRSKWGARRKGGPGRGGSSSPSPGGTQMALKAQDEGTDGSLVLQGRCSGHCTSPYTTVSDGGVIPLQDISCSFFPYGNGEHSSSRSTESLRHATSAHDLAITRRGSRTSFSSDVSPPSSVHDAPYAIQSSPTSPTPRRQYSLSSPEIRTPTQHSVLVNRVWRTPAVTGPLVSPSSAEMLSLPASTQIPSSKIGETYGLEQPHLIPTIPENFARYQKRQIISKEMREVELPPLTTDFVDSPDPLGWTYFAHPEGGAYFYHEEKRIFTDTDLFDHGLLGRINEDIELIETYFTNNNLTRPPMSDLVLDLNFDIDDGTSLLTYYYLADHASRVIFFLDAWNPDCLNAWYEVSGVTSLRQIRHEMEAQYWYHCQTYPNCLELTVDMVWELGDTAVYFIGDCMTSSLSTSPYLPDELHKILDVAGSLEQNAGRPSMGSVALTCRFFYVFARTRFINFHGTPAARLEWGHSVHGTVPRRTWLIKTSSMFLFSAPDVHLRNLQKLWVDGLLHKGFYEQAMKKTIAEWQDLILAATVMLNANVAFLAIQSVDVQKRSRSSAQISSYISVFVSVGSIIVGLLLVRQHQYKHRDWAVDLQNWLNNRSNPSLGPETLAIMFSLPYALLMWGMISFLCSFSLMAFQNSSIPTVAIVGVCSVIVGFLAVCCVSTAWEKQQVPEDLYPLPKIPPNNDEVADSQLPEPLPVSSQSAFDVVTTFPALRWRWFPFLSRQNRAQSGDSDATVV